MPTKFITGVQTLGQFNQRNDDSIVFVEDGASITASALRTTSRIILDQLVSLNACRMAVFTNRPSILAAALLACSEAGLELLIQREPNTHGNDLCTATRADVVLEKDLTIRKVNVINTISSPGKCAVLIPTSGTSGTPKIAHHSLATLLGRIRAGNGSNGPAHWLLTFQANGFAGLQIILTALVTDAVLICSSELNVSRLVGVALANGVTHISGTPTFWRSFLMNLGDAACRIHLEQATLGGEVVDQTILDLIHRTFPLASISHIYASTEAGSLFSVRDGRAGFPAKWLDEPVDGVSLRIRTNLLEVSSPRMMAGYLHQGNKYLTSDGWLITFDRVEQKDDRVYFLGRDDVVINVGGAKVNPEEVEAVLFEVAGVNDLRAFAVPNPITGFVVGLEIVPAAGSDQKQLKTEIVKVAGSKLETYKIPRIIRFVEGIRYNGSGKKTRKS